MTHNNNIRTRREYLEYLRSDKWMGIRAAKLSTNPKCEKCGTNKSLHIHHLTYERVYNESIDDLQTLCRKCHCEAHDIDYIKPRYHGYKYEVAERGKINKLRIFRSSFDSIASNGYCISELMEHMDDHLYIKNISGKACIDDRTGGKDGFVNLDSDLIGFFMDDDNIEDSLAVKLILASGYISTFITGTPIQIDSFSEKFSLDKEYIRSLHMRYGFEIIQTERKFTIGRGRIRTRIEESVHYVGFLHQQEVINETSNNN